MKYDNLELRKELISAIVEQIKIKELKQHDAFTIFCSK
jgi:predicted XRE-type DNA-binding protein